MSRITPRKIVLLMAREIDPEDAIEDDEYIGDWVPEHRHPDWSGGPDCAACWVESYNAAVARESNDYEPCADCEAGNVGRCPRTPNCMLAGRRSNNSGLGPTTGDARSTHNGGNLYS
ncbi:hypothetical protein [Paramicrobacterium chengjingii]|uniref:Uncharacterized protein n=1 Tax=Paramicrobacterium chengjingii TaxID=2769067 RepID=A0ABX6YLJ9_9MICO|nr:hypothetical protein [Microbacterium chengjingii]QPZ39714.1 hypothetical protein HCR76_06625 [Microbacterium chengjingii]